MNEPTGPLPKAVYLRRRMLAVAASALGVLLLVWVIGALFGGDSRATGSAGQATGVPMAVLRSTGPAPSVTTTSSPATSSSTTSGSSGSSTASASSTSSTSSVSSPASSSGSVTSTSAGGSAAGAAPTSAPPPVPAVAPGPPQPCADAATKITASVGQPSYRVGEQPVFTLHVTNAGAVACTRDISRPLRSLVVVPASGAQPLWSSADCYTVAGPPDVRTLQPGESASYSVTWAGRTSAPGCPAARRTVPAGQYALIGRLGALASAPTPFTLTG